MMIKFFHFTLAPVGAPIYRLPVLIVGIGLLIDFMVSSKFDIKLQALGTALSVAMVTLAAHLIMNVSVGAGYLVTALFTLIVIRYQVRH